MAALQYFPNIVSYVASLRDEPFDTLGAEPYRKMSFRNRCIIAAANGPLTLSVPIQGGRGVRISYRDVRVCDRLDWKDRHWKTIASAYGRSPWFFQYAESLEALYRSSHERLIDWNLACLEWVDHALGFGNIPRRGIVVPETTPTSDMATPRDYQDPSRGPFPAYVQLFQEKNGFLPNLSILDFVMCAGRSAPALFSV
jgi:hypothetical protein